MVFAIRHGVLLYEAMGLNRIYLIFATVSFFMRQRGGPQAALISLVKAISYQ